MMYFIQVVTYSGLMLLVYLLLLRDRPLHRFNRAYLLAVAVLPLVLPLLQLPQALRPQTESKMIAGILPELVVGTANNTQAMTLPLWLTVSALLYITVALVIAALKIKSYTQLRRLIKRSDKVQQDGYVLLKHTGYGPGSWGRYILLPDGDVDDAIIRHEQQHIQLRHSRDMVFISIMQAVTWPNPFVHFIKKELVQVHEFQADAAVAIQPEAYSTLLLSSVFNTCTLPLTHSFIIHPIKRRIMMLHKNKSASKTRSIIAAVCTLALAGGIITLQSCEQKMDNKKKPQKQHIVTEGAVAFTHKMPEPGYNLSEFLGKHIVYPQEAQDKGIEGRIIIKFVVDRDGHIRDIHPAKTDYNPLLADAAMTVVAALPDWVPGEDEKGNKVNVMYTLPITFKLSDDDKDKTVRYPGNGNDATFKVVEKGTDNATDSKTSTGGITMIKHR